MGQRQRLKQSQKPPASTCRVCKHFKPYGDKKNSYGKCNKPIDIRGGSSFRHLFKARSRGIGKEYPHYHTCKNWSGPVNREQREAYIEELIKLKEEDRIANKEW